MSELVWFVAGATATGLAIYAAGLRRSPTKQRRSRIQTSQERQNEPDDSDEQAAAPDEQPMIGAPQVVSSIADEIADLASAIEGAAFELVAAAPEPNRLPHAAQHFLGSVQRLRSLHGKLFAFASDLTPSTGTADLGEVVASLTEDLQRLRLGLELEAELTAGLPPTAAGPETVRNALLFVCSAMFRAEPAAMHLSIVAERSLAHTEPLLRIELLLESVVDAHSSSNSTLNDPSVTLAVEAATRLVECHGGELTLTRLPGGTVRTLVLLPATDSAEAIVAPTDPPSAAGPRHQFGGALVVEADPGIRAMLAKELQASGRAVFACADGTSARTFLEATPNRFELLIVDQQHRLDDGDALGDTIRRLTPKLKICVLSPAGEPHDQDSFDRWPGLRRIEKPFGVHELRQALASVLGAR